MPDMALVCLSRLYQSGVNIVGVVPPEKENNTHSYFVQFATSLGYNVIPYDESLKDEKFLKELKKLDIDIAVVCSYNRLFPPEFLAVAKDGFINTHPSLLPDYRGGNPYSHVIINNEKETGVTLHFMDDSFDTGDIITQCKIAVSKDETMGTLFNKLNYLSAEAILKILAFYEETATLPRFPQPKGEFKKANSIDLKFGNSYIDWTRPASEIERFIRALNPFISAVTKYKNDFVKIYSSSVKNKRTKEAPGTICCVKDTIDVATGDGILEIRALQIGSYVIGDAKDFIKTVEPKIGEKFEL